MAGNVASQSNLVFTYNTLYKDTLDDIEFAKETIDVTYFKEEVAKIQTKLNNELTNYEQTKVNEGLTNNFNQDYLEQIYNEAIKSLNSLREQMNKYNPYFNLYYQAKTLVEKIKKDSITEEDIKSIALDMIKLMNLLNKTKSIVLKDKEELFFNLYNLSFNIIKIELTYLGKSEVLDYCLKNKIANEYLNLVIGKELKSYQESFKEDEFLKILISEINQGGTNRSFVNEQLIVYLMLKDSKNNYVQKVLDNYYRLQEQIKDNLDQEKESEKKIDTLKDKIKTNNNHIFKELSVILAFITAFTWINYAASKQKKNIIRYKTKVEAYSTEDVIQTPLPEEISSRLNNSLKYYVYTPWEETDKGYQRKVNVYNITDYEDVLGGLINNIYEGIEESEVFNSQNQMSILNNIANEFLKGHKSVKTETKAELSSQDMYDEAIWELVKIEQNHDDPLNMGTEFSLGKALLVLLSGYVALLGFNVLSHLCFKETIISAFKSIYLKYKYRLNRQEERKQALKEMEEEINLIKVRALQNEEYHKNVQNIYNLFQDTLKRSEGIVLVREKD